MAREGTLRVRVTCSPVPASRWASYDDIHLAMQRGKEWVQDQPCGGEPLTFEAEVRLQPHAATGEPNFLGPYAHGTPADRFLYLVWTASCFPVRTSFGRIKIRLTGMDWPLIERAVAEGRPIRGAISAVGRSDGPAYASVKLLPPGWTLEEAA